MSATSFDSQDRFELLYELGRGAMGVVYAAQDRELNQPIALKVLPASEPGIVANLKHEFRLLRMVRHSNVVRLHELFLDENGKSWFTMDRIRGGGFLEAIRKTLTQQDEDQARALILQVVSGISAIHEAGAVHRDIKPSNLMVSEAGQVQVLDFGLADLGRRVSEGSELAGTLAYLAPEAIWGMALPASDWFSLGVVLYQVLLDELPWRSADLRKRTLQASWSAPSGTWPWLERLIRALVQFDPMVRPDGQAIRAMLTGEPLQRRPRAFVGRAATLHELDTALCMAEDGEQVLVDISGSPGVGKSQLLRSFLERIPPGPEYALLHGQCHHTERIPYRALDPILEELGKTLRRRAGYGDAVAVDLLTRWRTLGQLPGSDGSPGSQQVSTVPSEQRRAAIQALQRILQDLRARSTVIIILDDVQWGDASSAALLHELLKSPGPVLLILTRRDDADEGEFWSEWSSRSWPGSQKAVSLEPLSHAQSIQVIQELCPALSPAEQDAVAVRAAGIPFLLEGLSRDTSSHSVAEMIQNQARDLDSTATEMLHLIALDPSPVPSAVLLETFSDPGPAILALRELDTARLIQLITSSPQVGLYHELLREPILTDLPPARREAMHSRLADALAMLTPALHTSRAHHLVASRRTPEARGVALEAADAARTALEFLTEAAWLERALDWTEDPRDVLPLLERLAGTWKDAGHYGKSAEVLLKAIAMVGTEKQDALKASAAEALTSSGQIEAGEALYREQLLKRGLGYTASPGLALARGVWHRLVTNLMSFQEPRQPGGHDPADMALLRSVAGGLSMSRLQISFAMSGLHFARAMRGGSALDQVYAIETEATIQASLGGAWAKRSEGLIERMARLFDEHEIPDSVTIEQTRGPWHWHFGRWQDCAVDCAVASQHIRENFPGLAFRLWITDSFGLSARSHMGDFETLGEDVDRALQSALDRGDLHAHIFLDAGDVGIRYFVRGDIEGAASLADRIWDHIPPDAGVMEFSATTHIARTMLYRGEYEACANMMAEAIPRMKKNQALSVRVARAVTTELYARALLGQGQDARRALDRCDRTLAAIDIPWIPAMRAKLRAGRLLRAGQADEARAAYAEAARIFVACDMSLHAWAAMSGSMEEAPLCPVETPAPQALLGLLDPMLLKR